MLSVVKCTSVCTLSLFHCILHIRASPTVYGTKLHFVGLQNVTLLISPREIKPGVCLGRLLFNKRLKMRHLLNKRFILTNYKLHMISDACSTCVTKDWTFVKQVMGVVKQAPDYNLVSDYKY